MALTRTLPIKNRVFSSDVIALVLKELSSNYRKAKNDFTFNRYRLVISVDECTTTSIDSPPKSFEPLLNTPILHISLKIDCSKPNREIALELHNGSDTGRNSLCIHSDDEDWVNLTHEKSARLFENVEEQSVFLRKYCVVFGVFFAFLVGWPLKSLLLAMMLALGEVKKVPWSWSIYAQHWFMAGMLGFFPSAILLGYAVSAYPSVEIQTGPKKYWIWANRRSNMKLVLSLAVLAPATNLLYDLYKILFLS